MFFDLHVSLNNPSSGDINLSNLPCFFFLFYDIMILKSAQVKIIFLISQPKHLLWVFKRALSMRRFFCAPKTNVKNEFYAQIFCISVLSL